MRGSKRSKGQDRGWPEVYRFAANTVEDCEAISRRFPGKRSPAGNGMAMLSTSLVIPSLGFGADECWSLQPCDTVIFMWKEAAR